MKRQDARIAKERVRLTSIGALRALEDVLPGRMFFDCLLGLSLLVAAVSCTSRVEPLGKHQGHCNVSFHPNGAPKAQTPPEESCGKSFEVFKTGDGYKLSVGDCTIYLKPLERSTDKEWNLASPAPCVTKAGIARIVGGKLYQIDDTYNFSFDGITDDKKLSVSWGFSGDAPAPR